MSQLRRRRSRRCFVNAGAQQLPSYAWTGIYAGASVGGFFQSGGDSRCGPSRTGDVRDPGTEFLLFGVELGDVLAFCRVEEIAGDDGATNDVMAFPSQTSVGDEGDGILFDVHAGANWQRSGVVLGAEGDVSFLSPGGGGKGTDFIIFDGEGDDDAQPPLIWPGGAGTLNIRDRDWLATGRLRAGILLGERDRFLPYVTGGVALADAREVRLGFSTGLNDQIDRFELLRSDNDIDVGWTVGGGFDLKLTQRFSIGAEYLFVDLGSGDGFIFRYEDEETRQVAFSEDNSTLHIVRFRASFHFNGLVPSP